MTCFSFLCRERSRSATRHSEFGDELSGVDNVNLYSYKELRIATNDFSQANKIGEGGFGSVYKGKLRNGRMAAIKVLSSESRQGVREFLTEIQVISDIEHENLVKLYGCCVEGNHRILVYNYLENNSLAQTLIGGGHSSIGYLAPEYAIRGQLTRRADIYSFGVLLIEIVSGRCNTNTRLPMEEQYILERTWQLHERKELVALVDTSLNGDFDAEQACRFLKIGLLCTQDSPKLRPAMSAVVQMLTGHKNFDEDTITKPGLISDFMDLKIRSNPKPKFDNNQISSYYNSSGSGSDTLDNTTLTSAPSSQATMTFTAIYDRSM
ncbi:hypothetical protein BUALT_Bualt03G0164400 [Buddleja alternifolia]|uniref:Protein kinase domain-containing protein n=1 Tax=Buddleja alternifolia TaxID=168488 RepID=A0AAV6XWI1_9LAMI|nr:hypothetical protein BUALT_Bualt03G0164400 [Buddleja alternifolia]